MDTHGPQSSIMMERILLGVFYLSGWHILSSSRVLRQYHYVADHMNWTEAQTYCRQNYTDLATIENTEEMNQFIHSVSSFGYDSVWIGLYSKINWTWSDGFRGSGAEYRNWETGEPTVDYLNNYFCVQLGNTQRWRANDCLQDFPFICNNGTQQDPTFVFVNESLNWSSAQRYCRENFTDLASVRNDVENQEIQNMVPSGDSAWIGLFREPRVNWSDGSDFSFSHWHDHQLTVQRETTICGSAFLHRSGKWCFLYCEFLFPFVCYSVLPPHEPRTRQIVKLRVKRGDPSVDLNNPAVKADILKKLQKELQDKGISGVNLKWREQPDGKVFHKEGEASQKKKKRKTEL